MLLKFLTSLEGIACIFVSCLVLAGGISELIYFNRLCKNVREGYEDLGNDFDNLGSN